MATSSPASPGATPGKAHTLRAQGLVNAMTRGLLKTPGVSRGIGRRLILLEVVGRKSGKRYEIPTAYTDYEGSILVGSQFAWGRNLRTGEPIEVRHLGARRTADVEVIADEEGVVKYYGVMCRDNRSFAKFHHIGFGADGEPNAEDLRRTWRSGSRVFRLTLR